MKKSLMATTALVAASVAVSGAHAQDEMMAEPISLSLGGYSSWGVSLSSWEGTDGTRDSLGIANTSEVHFKGKTVLDNGLEVGVRFEIEGETHSDQMDETYTYVEGSFGTLRIGNDDAAVYQMSTIAPAATGMYGANTPSWSGTVSPSFLTTLPTGGTDSASVMYFTPVVNGFQFGISYAPEWGAEARTLAADNGEGKEASSVGARYDGSLGEDGSVTIAGGVATIADTSADDDTTDLAVGLRLSKGAYGIGASYRTLDDGSDESTITYEMGVQYSDGPLAVSLNWAHTEDDDDASTEADVYRVLGSYSLGAGVSLGGAIGLDRQEGGEDSELVGMGIAIGF